LDLTLQQLPPPSGHSFLIQSQDFSQSSIATVTLLDAFQARIEPALLLIQQAVEEHHGCPALVLLFIGALLQGDSGRSLFLQPAPFFGGIKISALVVLAMNASSPDQIPQSVFDRHMQQLVQFAGIIAGGRVLDQRMSGVQ
jgi:hypothetical protein